MVTGGLLPLLGLYLPVFVVELLMAERSMNESLLMLGGFAGVYSLLRIIDSVAEQGKYPFQNQIRPVYLRQLYAKAMDCDYRLIESIEGKTQYHKRLEMMSGGDGAPSSQMFNAMVGLISGIVSFGFLVWILSMLNFWILGALVVLSALGYFIDRVPVKFEENQREYRSRLDKKYQYLNRTMGDVKAGKDMRIYHLNTLFTRLCAQIVGLDRALRHRIGNRYFAAGFAQGLLAMARDGLAYAYCIAQVTQGNIAVPEFILYMGAISRFSDWLRSLSGTMIQLKRENFRLNEFRGFLESKNPSEPLEPMEINVLQGKMLKIEFKNVSFRYTPDTPLVLDDISLTINAGEKAALVGINGAGKTTIVKLLCGFYKADAGEILLNGYNINRFRRADLYSLFSAVFQDTCILPLTAGENVAMTLPDQYDKARLEKALKTAGIYDEIKKHPKGLQAHMTKELTKDGIELSGGQKQKLVLARALYKDAPLLILDEPTAALDPIAESEVYEGFHHVTRGKTALFISHRLASTRFCDRIFMLSGGKITENDSHENLLKNKGEYANMYEVQSHYYKQTEVQND